MRFIVAILYMCITCMGYIYAQSDCKPYLPVDKGAKWEISNYNAKGKLAGRTAFELIDKSEIADGLAFTVKSTSFDKKDKEIFENTYKAYCRNGKFEFDMALKIDGNSMQAYKDLDVKMNATEFEIPDMSRETGSRLKDGSITLEAGAAAAAPMLKMTISITDRIIDSKEDIKTPAGTFKCLVITQKINTKMIMKVEATSKEWYAEGIGMVRSESYNKNGKLMSYSELTKLSN